MIETETIANPLPLRLREVQTLRKRLLAGVVLAPTSEEEEYDISNAAQSIVLDHVLEQLMVQWTCPELLGEGNFYNRFAHTYYKYLPSRENAIWTQLVQKVVSDAELDVNHLKPLEAATLTLASISDFEDAAVS